MAKMIDTKPTENNGEKTTWEALSNIYSDDTVVYYNREIYGKEFDFCLLIPEKGILILEVKGWKAQDVTVFGSDEIEVKGFNSHLSSPKKQARAYRFNMFNMIKDQYNYRALVLDAVCYPFISKEEYYIKRLDIVSEETYTLFKEDLQSRDKLMQKIDTIFNLSQHFNHDEMDANLYNCIRKKFEVNYNPVKVRENNVLPYSKLAVFNIEISKTEIDELVKEYFLGIKEVIFFTSINNFNAFVNLVKDTYKSKNIDYDGKNVVIGNKNLLKNKNNVFRSFNLEVYCIDNQDNIDDVIVLEEAVGVNIYDKLLKKLSELSQFNYEQYILEHASDDINIIVKAGAGTGKTYSMVSRISYLCNKMNKSISNLYDELAMVTFTNDAASNMKIRLKNQFMNYYLLTSNDRYLNYIEDVNRANISTIHKFALELLRNHSVETGLSSSFELTSNEYIRDIIYSNNLDEFIKSRNEEDEEYSDSIPIPIYELKEKLKSIADKLLNKSIDFDLITIKSLGESTEDNIPNFVEMLYEVMIKSEKEYSTYINDIDGLELKECLILLKKIIIKNPDCFNKLKFKYILIDEFQDTDDSQIELFKRLQKSIGTSCKLFVVGDLKQSIYRFRGATISAFDLLRGKNDNEWQEYSLTRNYRTDKRLLEKFDSIFSTIGKMNYLPYTEEDKLTSFLSLNNETEKCLYCSKIDEKEREEFYNKFFELISAEKFRLYNLNNDYGLSESDRTIAILVRNNWQIEEIVREGSRRGISVEVTGGGNLFQLQSTIDLYKLLLALNNPNDLASLCNLIESNYINAVLNYQDFLQMTYEEKLNRAKSLLSNYLMQSIGISWFDLMEEVSENPILVVLKKLSDELKPWVFYSNDKNKQKEYIMNYKLIIEKISNYFNDEYLTVSNVFNYLKINILTKQKELSRQIDGNFSGVKIICSTIHKSKGLEYGTVVLPFTNSNIDDVTRTKLEADFSKSKLSFLVLFDSDIKEQNDNYCDIEERKEQINEECRILYVAMTRAIRRFIWIKDTAKEPRLSWSTLLEDEDYD